MSSERQYASHARILHKQCSRMVCIFCSTTRNRLPFSGLVTKSRFREFKQGNGVLTRPDLRSTYTQLRTRSPTLSSFDNPEISSRFHFEGVMDLRRVRPSRPVLARALVLHNQAQSGAYSRDSSRFPRQRRPSIPSTAIMHLIGSVPSLSSHHAIASSRVSPEFT